MDEVEGVHMDEMSRKEKERKKRTLYLLPAELRAADQRDEDKNKNQEVLRR